MNIEFMDSPTFSLVILPLLIFLARILDVSIGTMRIILIGKGYRIYAALLGFVEVFIWILAIGQIMQNLTNILNYFAYALGFSAGTYIGMVIEQKISIGKVVLRIVTRREATELLEHLIIEDYHITTADAEGRFGDVKIIFMVLPRKMLKKVIGIINRFNPRAFYTIEDVRFVNEYPHPKHINPFFKKVGGIFRWFNVRK